MVVLRERSYHSENKRMYRLAALHQYIDPNYLLGDRFEAVLHQLVANRYLDKECMRFVAAGYGDVGQDGAYKTNQQDKPLNAPQILAK